MQSRAHFGARFHSGSQSGQVGIIIILIMIVLLTIGLSLAQQTTKEVILSNQEDESTRVFNAAEAGVEQALTTDVSGAQTTYTGTATVPGSNATVNYTITKMNTLDTRLPQGGTALVKLADPGTAPAVTGVTINWARETVCTQTPATLIAAIFSYDATKNPKSTVRYQAFAPCDYGDTMPVTSTAGNNGFFRSTTIAVGSKDISIRIKPYYNDTALTVAGVGGTLPTQGYTIQSTAVNQLGTNNETRSVQVNKTLSLTPSLMDYVLFSGTAIVK